MEKLKLTVKGVAVEVDPRVFDSADLLEVSMRQTLAAERVKNAESASEKKEAEQEAQLASASYLLELQRLLFPKNWAKIKDKLRDKTGFLSVETLTEFFTELGEKVSALKK